MAWAELLQLNNLTGLLHLLVGWFVCVSDNYVLPYCPIVCFTIEFL